MTQFSPRRCFDWAVKVASSALYTHIYMCQFNAPDVSDVSTRLRLESCGPLEIMPRELLECAQPPPPRPHSSRATTNNPRCQVQQALQPGRATWAIGSLDWHRVPVGGEFSIKSKLWAACCDLSTWLNCSACPRFRVHVPLPVPLPAPWCLLPVPVRFRNLSFSLSVSQAVCRSVAALATHRKIACN